VKVQGFEDPAKNTKNVEDPKTRILEDPKTRTLEDPKNTMNAKNMNT